VRRSDDRSSHHCPHLARPHHTVARRLGVQSLREDRDNESEFITISYWESVEAMSRFTGGDPTRIHHLPRDKEFLIELPERVQILNIRAAHGNTAGDVA
jgi:hypothetical protein